jgi:hypothetical protein
MIAKCDVFRCRTKTQDVQVVLVTGQNGAGMDVKLVCRACGPCRARKGLAAVNPEAFSAEYGEKMFRAWFGEGGLSDVRPAVV